MTTCNPDKHSQAHTVVEACARELTSLAKGQIVHDMHVLQHAAADLRSSFMPEVFEVTVALHAHQIHQMCIMMVKSQLVALGATHTVQKDAIARVEEVNTADPLTNYSDKHEWWPLVAPVKDTPLTLVASNTDIYTGVTVNTPNAGDDWLLAFEAALVEAEETQEEHTKTLVHGSPSRHFSDGKRAGLHLAKQLYYRHKPAEVVKD